ncbi:MAG TPA: hypothetical protein VFX12_03785 [Vicinamibacterales bacterium]|nr:hypothetical protein [Vicinamibacterales bacterium]
MRALPKLPGKKHRQDLHELLREMAWSWGGTTFNRRLGCLSGARPVEGLGDFRAHWATPHPDPVAFFEWWALDFLARLDAAYPQPLAERAAAWIRDHPESFRSARR